MTQNNDRFTSPLGLNDDGKPWKEEDIHWEFDKNGMIVMKKNEANIGDSDDSIKEKIAPKNQKL